MVRALREIHEAGYVHARIKLENFCWKLADEKGCLKAWLVDMQRAFHIFERRLRRMCPFTPTIEEVCELFRLSEGCVEQISGACAHAKSITKERREAISEALSVVRYHAPSSSSSSRIQPLCPKKVRDVAVVDLNECQPIHDPTAEW